MKPQIQLQDDRTRRQRIMSHFKFSDWLREQYYRIRLATQ